MTIDTKWTYHQTVLILESVKARLESNPAIYEIQDKKDEVSISNKSYNDDRVSLNVYKNSRTIYICIGDHWGRVEFSPFFWQDKEGKALHDYFLNIKVAKVENTSMAAILKVFPEVVNREFEKQFLKDNYDDKSKKEK